MRGCALCVLLALAFAPVSRPQSPGFITTFAGSQFPTQALSFNLQPGYAVTALADGTGGVYFLSGWASGLSAASCLRYVSPTGAGYLVAGSCATSCGAVASGVPANSTTLCSSKGALALNSSGIFLADAGNYRIRYVDLSSGIISDVVGNSTQCTRGLQRGRVVPGTSTCLSTPSALAPSPDRGSILFADSGGGYVGRLFQNGSVVLVAGVPGGALPTPGTSGDGGSAFSALMRPNALAINASGDIFFSDATLNTIRMISASTGLVTLLVGISGSAAVLPAADGPPLLTPLCGPGSLTMNTTSGALIIGEVCGGSQTNGRVRALAAPTASLVTLAGGGSTFSSPTPASSCDITNPFSVSYEANTRTLIFVASKAGNPLIRRLSTGGTLASGAVTTVVGPGSWPGSFLGQPATALQFAGLKDVKVDPVSQSLALVDIASNLVALVSAAGVVLPTQLGSNDRSWGSWGVGGASSPSSSVRKFPPKSVAADKRGGFFFHLGATPYLSQIVHLPPSSGMVYIVAGNWSALTCGGNGGPASAASFGEVYGMVVNGSAGTPGSALLFSEGAVIRRIDLSDASAATGGGGGGVVSHFAGVCGVFAPSGEGVPAATSPLARPYGLALDLFNTQSGARGALLVAEYDGHRIRRISLDTGLMSTLVGTGAPGNVFNVPGASALIRNPYGIAVDPLCGTVFFSDAWNCLVKRLEGNSSASTVRVAAGAGANGWAGDGGPAIGAVFSSPSGIDIDAAGRLFIADGTNGGLRVVAPGGASGACAPPTPTAPPSPSPLPTSRATPTMRSHTPSLSSRPSPTPTASPTPPPACPPATLNATLTYAYSGRLAMLPIPPTAAGIHAALWGGGAAGGAPAAQMEGGGHISPAGCPPPPSSALKTAPCCW